MSGSTWRSSPLVDRTNGGLSYKQRIQLVYSLEPTYKLTIPDEHWQQMTNVAQLVDYLEKRKQIEHELGSKNASGKQSWPQIQQSFPVDARPIYKK